MPETRYVDQFANGVLVNRVPYTVSDEELAWEADESEVRAELIQKGRQALANWDTLTNAQVKQVVKALLRLALRNLRA